MGNVRDNGNRVLDYLIDRIRIDTRTLAVFRMLVGTLIVADILIRARSFRFFYTDSGVVPLSLAMDRSPTNAFSFFYMSSDPVFTAILFVLHGLIAIQLIIGYKTRIAAILSFLFVVSLDHRNPLILSHADTLFRFLLFWAMFLPLGERWSIDAIHRREQPPTSVANLASAAILLQMIYMYLANGYHKTQSALWGSGEATPLIFGLDDTTYLLGDFMRNFPTLLQYGGLMWFYMMLMSWLLLLAPGRLRMLLVALYAGAHASFAITVRIGAFPYVAIAGVLLFLPAQFWTDLQSLLARAKVWDRFMLPARSSVERFGYRTAALLPELRLGYRSLQPVRDAVFDMSITIAVFCVLIVPGVGFLSTQDILDRNVSSAEQQIARTTAIFGVRQPPWTVFAPNPRTIDRYYVFPALTVEGQLVDVFNERPLTFDRAHAQLNRQYGTYRERFYLNSVRRGGADGETPKLFAEYLCDRWRDDYGIEITHINMYVINEQVTMDTIADPTGRESRRNLFHMHGCGDNERMQIPIQ